MQNSTAVLFVLDENGEANGTVRYYCGTWCRDKAMQTNEDPVAAEFSDEYLPGTQCENCGQEVGDLSETGLLHNCEDCGHEEIDHDGECWHGLVEGKRCACCQYVPDACN